MNREFTISVRGCNSTNFQLGESLQERLANTIKHYDMFDIKMNDDIEFLRSIEDKNRIRLFATTECSHKCPSWTCYKQTGEINKRITMEIVKGLCMIVLVNTLMIIQ